MTTDETVDSSEWSWEQEKAFENALAVYPEDSTDRWERIAGDVPGKSIEDIKQHYDFLVDDINEIESGRIPLPCYVSSSEGSGEQVGEGGSSKKDDQFQGDSSQRGKSSRLDQERRKGIAWTEEEHRLFLLGLDKYGKGDWRSISRNFVVTRTPTQVASHAQKYFIRLTSMKNKDRRRTSIHDITSVGNNEGDTSTPQGPITGQTNGNLNADSSGKKQPPHTAPASTPGVGTTTIGQPVGSGPLVSTVGTPVSLPAPGHMAYGVRAPIPGPMVTGSPVNMAYKMPHTSAAHR